MKDNAEDKGNVIKSTSLNSKIFIIIVYVFHRFSSSRHFSWEWEKVVNI